MPRNNVSTSRSTSPASSVYLEAGLMSHASTAPCSSYSPSPSPKIPSKGLRASIPASIVDDDEDMDADVAFNVDVEGPPTGVTIASPSTPPPEASIEEDQYQKLHSILEKSALFSRILQERMEEDKVRQAQVAVERGKCKPVKASDEDKSQGSRLTEMKGKKRLREEVDDHRAPGDDISSSESDTNVPIFPQPSLITGAKMMNHQLEGLQWMVALHQNGIAGILGDEMGLGKTLQTISFAAYLLESNFKKPFLILCPLSVLNNWIEEFRKFAPGIPVCMYHGTPAERAELRKSVMVQLPENDVEESVSEEDAPGPQPRKGKERGKCKSSGARRGRATKKSDKAGKQAKLNLTSTTGKTANAKTGVKGTRVSKRRKVTPDDTEDDEELPNDAAETSDLIPPSSEPRATFPVIVTTYEIVIRDRAHLQKYNWGYIVVDEGHRLKNIDCRLIREVKKLGYGGGGDGGGRMILTGTPLQNNIAELWSLLNFVLPDIFKDIDTFQDMFNLPTMEKAVGSERAGRIISSLHGILKPFLLRRLKSDVFKDDGSADGSGRGRLPPKKEYVLYAPLTEIQRELYERVVNGNLRSWLIIKGGGFSKISEEEAVEVKAEVPGKDMEAAVAVEEKTQRKLRSDRRSSATPMPSTSKTTTKGKDKDNTSCTDAAKPRARRRATGNGKATGRYDVDGDDDEYFEMLEKGMLDERGLVKIGEDDEQTEALEMLELGRQHEMKAAIKHVNSMKLQNPVMQLRNVCSHPFLFDWPTDPSTRQPVVDDRLVDYSGKMMVLERLLDGLFARGHKVLLFSQFTKMLDIIEDWATELKTYPICRIDGSTPSSDRIKEVARFQNGGNAPDAPILFLLSTRAGGLGINLTAADTVVFYDQDWNPQMDIQAQDRAHRIGQTKPVLIYRLVSAHTIEEKIMERATEKRKLEALVIAKGKFKMPGVSSSSRALSLAELASDLLALEGEKINVVPNTRAGKKGVLSDADLDALLDRSDSVFVSSAPEPGVTVGVSEEKSIPIKRGDGRKAAFSVYNSEAASSNLVEAKNAPP